MPCIRRQDEEEDYQCGSSSIAPTSRTKYARKATRNPISTSVDVLPFPIGAPQEPVHHALLFFCTPPISSQELGEVDNLVTFLMFATKNTIIRPLSLVITPFPNAPDYTRTLTRSTRRMFHALLGLVRDVSALQWLPIVNKTLLAMAERVPQSSIHDVLLSDSFSRYLLLRDSSRVRVGKILFPGHSTAQAAIKAIQSIPADTFLWELNAVLSSDSNVSQSISNIQPHACQKLSPGPRHMAGGARFTNHNCKPNALLEPIPEYAIFVIKTLKDISSGDEITVDYGAQYWIDGKCPCSSCTGQAPILDINEMNSVLDNSNESVRNNDDRQEKLTASRPRKYISNPPNNPLSHRHRVNRQSGDRLVRNDAFRSTAAKDISSVDSLEPATPPYIDWD